MLIGGRALRRIVLAAIAIAAALLVAGVWGVIRSPIDPAGSPLLARDVTQLNPILVNEVIAPTTTEEIIQAVKTHAGPISVGGARHSMGGQIATDGALHIDMRRFDRIVDFSPTERTITVQAGARWRQILERVDPANLSVSVMQSYANTNESYRLNRFVYWVVSEWPFGKVFREHVVDPVLFRGESVTWRNYQSSYDVAELEPASRTNSTYALEEYLPYQLHATEAQFRRAYPRADGFFALKGRLDPTNKFRNQLWNKYYHPAAADLAVR